MRRVLIIGNSGSGKSTLAKRLANSEGLAHLDLDTLAWKPVSPPERKPLYQSEIDISDFIGANRSWVIEGCYTDLFEIALPASNEIIYLNLSVNQCIENARNRAWEPHKYASKEAQDANIAMLISWISEYPTREDVFSKRAHQQLYNQFSGTKRMITENQLTE